MITDLYKLLHVGFMQVDSCIEIDAMVYRFSKEGRSMKITYKITKDDINWKEVAAVLDRSGLSHLPPEKQKAAFTNSYAVVFVYDGNKIVGVARALSDGVCQGAIYNVALDPDYQGYGIGKEMIRNLLRQLAGQNVILYTHPKTISLYERMGFRRAKSAMEYFDIDEEHLEWMEQVGFFLPEGYRFCDEYGREDMKYQKPKHGGEP